ncbi:MAG: hypothetical protein H5T59_01120 [Anaerolineae bacterium]|nr:hypothetical protein [Anaerolineae bacterium]
MSLRRRLAEALFADILHAHAAEALKVYDDRWWARLGAQRDEPLDPDSPLAAYRQDPLAFRITQILVGHVLGEGVAWPVEEPALRQWLDAWWTHPLNQMDLRIRQWLTELILTGDLFVTFHTRPDGLSILRAVPSSQIDEVESAPQDLEDEVRYHQVGTLEEPEGRWWTAVAHGGDMLHFAINRPVGHVRGQSDLATVLPWLRRYREWLADRVAINRARSAFVYEVTVRGTEADVRRRKAELGAPPPPGSVVIHNEAEEWKTITAHVDAGDAEADGKALRLMVAAGAGIPLHFLSEGESATRATAREMGEPTRRAFAERQQVFGAMLQQVAREAVRRAVERGAALPADAPALVAAPRFPDLTREDNLTLAQAAAQIVEALTAAVARGWLTDEEAAAWLRKFAGEAYHGPTTP